VSEATWIEVMFIAAGAQLAVLPGEKVQFIIAGLSTRYNPLMVVGAAGTAFAGWTLLEIWVGQTLLETVPGIYLDAATAVLFLGFAVLLVRSAPGPDESLNARTTSAIATGDGGELDVRVPYLDLKIPNTLGGFLPIFAMMAFGEFGDKTQIITISLATQYAGHPSAIWTGEMLAIIPVSMLNALFFYRFSHRFDLRKAHFAGAVLFTFFAADFAVRVLFGFSVWEELVATVSGLLPSMLGLFVFQTGGLV
jgi:putative Ca2+/H+ antiporter (TMEM165/GDT1 family)